MKVLGNRVAIELPEVAHEQGSYVAANGAKLFLPRLTSTNDALPKCGVVALGEHAGKLAYFESLCYDLASKAQGGRTIVSEGGKRYMLILKQDIFFYKSGETFEMQNGYYLALVHEQEGEKFDLNFGAERYAGRATKSDAGLFIPDSTDNTFKRLHAKIEAVGTGAQLSVGDVVLMDKCCDLPVDNRIQKTLDKDYIYVHEDDILYKVNT